MLRIGQKNLSTKNYQLSTSKAFSLLEVVLSIAIFAIFSLGVTGLIIQGLHQNRLAGDQTIATQYASEGLEASRSIRNQSFDNLSVNAGTGLIGVGGIWGFGGVNNTYDNGKYTRVVRVEEVRRDVSGNIVSSGGTVDTNTFRIVSTVNWNFTPTRQNSVVLSTYLARYDLPVTPLRKNGFLVYADSSFGADRIAYKSLDINNNIWSTVDNTTTIDVDGGSATNKAPRAMKLYSDPVRDQKILLSRHYNGTSQFIYATVCDNCSQATRTLTTTQLSTWNNKTNLDVQNFDGTYLANGEFLALFSNNSTTPQSRVWNGSVWGTATSTRNIGGVPNYIILRQRSDTNEAMAAFFDQSMDTNSQYFYIGANNTYETADWTLHTEHAAVAPVTTKKLVDFSWSSGDPTKGALIYVDSGNDKAMNLRIFTANRSGGGSWAATNQFSPNQKNNIGAITIASITGTSNYVVCDKDDQSSTRLICMRATNAGWVNSSDTEITRPSDNTIQPSFAAVSEPASNPNFLTLTYSDTSGQAQLRKFNTMTNIWDVPSNINSVSVGAIKSMRGYANLANNNILYLIADANLDLFTVGYDVVTGAISTTGSEAWTAHGTSGSNTVDLWYDFAWDN